ncbi:membrane protein [Candidatus Photodesmus blepharus]|uniref:Membrane protein n=1 Tax=Candidatus Photodesmus blepharonis TaxID=1179155 RepID=A0A084CPI5_9GAMM|nr:efflux RND transporter permease subunit [Candidatus Photodesmus blepharus]KEY91714.1 membrane protein [Candidatus Photodesmus blepharus]
MWLSDVSVKRPVAAIVLSLLLCVFGIVSFSKLSIREMPDIKNLVVSISTSYEGVSATVIETQVTSVLEDQLSGIDGVEKIVSSTEKGISLITVTFKSAYDINIGMNELRDAVSRARPLLPNGAHDPIILKNNRLGAASLYISFSSSKMNRVQLTDYIDRVLMDRFNLISGVSSVDLFGALHKVMYIKLKPDLMAGLSVVVSDIVSVLRSENIESPAGEISNDSTVMPVRVARSYHNVQDFENLVIKRINDTPIYLKNIADIYVGAKDDGSIFKSDGTVSVSMGIMTQSDANPLEVAHLVRAEVEKVQNSLPEGASLSIHYDSTVFIEHSIFEVYKTLLFTGICVVLVLYVFVGQIRVAFIPAITVPVSLISALIVAYYFGFSINLLTLMALILSIGLVVDDAIVVVENIFHHLEQGEPPLVAAYKGTREVSFAVIATTLVLVMVFLPISFMDGMIGLLFTEFSVLLAASVIFSSLIALTLTPVLSSGTLKSSSSAKVSRLNSLVNQLFTKLEFFYRSSLKVMLRWKWIPPVLVALCITGSFSFMNQVPSELVPVEDRGVIGAFVQGADATSNNRISNNMDIIEDRLMSMLDQGLLKSFSLQSPALGGSAGTGFVIILLEDLNKRNLTIHQVLERVSKALIGIPDVRIFPFIPGFRGSFNEPVQFVLRGSDYVELKEIAEVLRHQAEISPFLEGVNVHYSEKTPELVARINKIHAAELGIHVSDIASTLEIMLGGKNETTFVERGMEYDVYLRGDEKNFNNAIDLSKVYMRTRSGKLVVLNTVVSMEEVASPVSLPHYNKQKSITVTANISNGFTLGEALHFLDNQVIKVLPSDISMSYFGESKEYKENKSNVLTIFIISLLVAYLVLAAQFESFINPLVVMFTVPTGVFGGFLGLFLMKQGLNIYSQIGMIMLVGMVTKNGILIVEFANQLRDRGIEFEEAIIDAAVRRLRPIMMTAFTTIAGSIPLILSTGSGYENRVAVGTVIFFGMSFATLVTLFVIPTMYSLISASTQSPGHIGAKLRKELKMIQKHEVLPFK